MTLSAREYVDARPGPASESIDSSRLYRALLWSLRIAWLACVAAVVVMLPALMVRAPQLVPVASAVFILCFTACGIAALIFVPLAASLNRYGVAEPGPFGKRADALVAAVLADLLDPS